MSVPSEMVGWSQEERLVRRVAQGDRKARRGLVERLMPVVQARVRGRLFPNASRETVDDLVQQVWLTLVEQNHTKLLSFHSHRGSLESFVGQIAENEVLTALRRRQARKRGGHLTPVPLPQAGDREPSLTVSDPVACPESLTATADLGRRLVEHLASVLPERGMLVFHHVFTDGLDPAEAARIMGVKVQVVYNWQHKIRTLARLFLSL